MQKDFTTRLAALFVAAILISNDLLASVHAMANYKVYTTPHVKHVYTPKNYPGEAERPETPLLESVYTPAHTTGKSHKKADELILTADHVTGFLGNHEKDATGNPSDDVFSFTLEADPGLYTHATLRYTVTGLADGAALPKTINGKTTYGEANFAPGTYTQRIEQALNLEDFKQGVNQVVFSVPQGLTQAVEISSVALSLTNGEAAVAKAPAMKLLAASPFFFSAKSVADEAAAIGTYALQDYQMAFVPRSIRNTTLGAAGYRTLVGGNGNQVYISMKVNKALLMGTEKLKEVGIYFFDLEHKKWQVVRPEHVDITEMRVEATVPGNTDYFAGMITSPEMPEAAAYVPTAISDIEAANPAAGMNLMSPPDISHTGEASLSYPLAIPQGRQGMTPQLALSYNSDGGTGWLGVGWNINTPSVSIDTRWGVPIFDATHETEVYSLNGQSLVMQGGIKANRVRATRIANAFFFEQTMQAYKKIQRVGSNTTNYYWKEITADSTTYLYGRLDEASGNPAPDNYTLKDSQGNITKWFLAKVIDKWGNTITYQYERNTVSNTGDLTNGATTITLKSIEYTGTKGTADHGAYKVEFFSTYNRADATVSLKSGVKELDGASLNRIDVSYSNTLIKQFKFAYSEGDFYKTILDSVSEYRNNLFFYKHSFEYHSQAFSYGNEEVIEVTHRNPNVFNGVMNELAGLIAPLSRIVINSPIKTTQTLGWGIGGTLGVGISPGTNTFDPDRAFTISGSLGYSENKSVDKISLMDMDGNGLPDVVYDQSIAGRGFYSMAKDQYGNLELLDFKRIHYNGDLFTSRSSSINYGLSYTMPAGQGYTGVSWNKGTSKTSNYLTDYNADGILDLVVPTSKTTSAVLFGLLNERNELYFENNSEHTYSKVFKSAALTEPDNPGVTKDFEIVRTWEAPFEGVVDITGVAQVISDLNGDVEIAIQLNNTIIYGFNTLQAHSQLQTDVPGVAVHKGDLLLFRVYSGEDGQEDFVSWNPTVSYNNTIPEANGIDYLTSTYEEGFLLSGGDGVMFSGDEAIRVELNDNLLSTLTDDIVLTMRVKVYNESDGSFVREDVWERDIYADGSSSADYLLTSTGDPAHFTGNDAQLLNNVNATEYCVLTFEVFSTSNVQWKNIQWRPVVYFDDLCSKQPRIVYPTVWFKSFNRLEKLVAPATKSSFPAYAVNDQLQVVPVFSNVSANYYKLFKTNETASPATDYFRAFITVKNNGKAVYKYAIKFTNDPSNNPISFIPVGANGDFLTGSFANHTFSGSALVANQVFVEIFSENARVARFIKDQLVRFEMKNKTANTKKNNSSAYNHFSIDRTELQDQFLHWGQFAWSNASQQLQAIDTADLHLATTSLAKNNTSTQPDLNQMETLISNNAAQSNPLNATFAMLMPMRGERTLGLRSYINQPNLATTGTTMSTPQSLDRWAAFNSYMASYAASGAVTPGKLGEPEIVPVANSFTPNNFGAFAIGQNGRSASKSNSLKAPGTSVSSTVNDPNLYYSESVSSFQDINGDGFPDALFHGTILQAALTLPTGGHTATSDVYSLNAGKSISESNNVHVSPGAFIGEDKRFLPIDPLQPDIANSSQPIELVDINGDGLPDRITYLGNGSFTVNTNRGKMPNGTANVFGPDALFGAQVVNQGASQSETYGLSQDLLDLKNGKNKVAASFQAGVGISIVASTSKVILRDVNGDGLPDYLVEGTNGNTLVAFNKGTSFATTQKTTGALAEGIGNGNSLGFSADAAATFSFSPIPISFASLKFSINANGSANFSLNESNATLTDMNGDGIADYVYSTGDGKLHVRMARFGKSNKLKTVTNPLKGSFTIDYELIGNKRGYYPTVVKTHMTTEQERMAWDMPEGKYVMSSLTMNDGLDVKDGTNDIDGSETTKVYFAYDGGLKSRRERQFLGFTRTEKRYLPNEDDFFMSTNNPSNQPQTFISEVSEFESEEKIDPSSQLKDEYTKNLSRAYTLYSKLEGIDINGELVVSRTIKPITIQNYSYDYRHVAINTTDANFKRVAKNGTNWVPVNWATVTETACIFPALVATSTITFPQVEEANMDDLFYAMRYTIDYDDYFNVTRYANQGLLTEAHLVEVVVDTIYHSYYDVRSQDNQMHLLYADNRSPGLDLPGYDAFIVRSDVFGYQDDTLMIPLVNDCFPGGDLAIVKSTHKKLVTDIIYIKELQDASTYTGAIIAEMDYFTQAEARRRTNALKEHRIYLGSNAPANLRRKAKVHALTTNQLAPEVLHHYWDATNYAVTEIAYNSFGNVTSVKAPANHKGQRLQTTFTYETTLNQFVTGISNDYNDATCMKYDFATGNLLRTVDINGHPTQYVYDDFYRVKEIWAPRELATANSAPTITFSYHPYGINKASQNGYDKVPVAITSHNMARNEMPANYTGTAINCSTLVDVSNRPAITNALRTATFIDGLQRPIQIKKDAAQGAGVTVQVSGMTYFDHLGREASTTIAQLTSTADFGRLIILPSSAPKASTTTFDYVNRPILVSAITEDPNPLERTPTEMKYSWDVSKYLYYEESVVNEDDPASASIEAAINRAYKDSWGRTTLAESWDDANPIIRTFFGYNELGELLNTTNPLSQTTSYTYDWLGRTLTEQHPDRGTTTMTYDAASNVRTIHNAAMPSATTKIKMQYHYNRLVKKTLPTTQELYGLYFEYGYLNDGKNGAGRVVEVRQGLDRLDTLNLDAQFKTEQYKYDELGNMVFEHKHLLLANNAQKQYTTHYRYDSWGRALEITYPDGENVKYAYLPSGELHNISSKLANENTYVNILREATYDGFGNMATMEYGNGALTTFAYNTYTQRLTGVQLETWVDMPSQTRDYILNKTYSYDPLGRVAHVTNQQGAQAINLLVGLGADYSINYQYDWFNRLGSSDATVNSNQAIPEEGGAYSTQSYELTMTYNNAGGITFKTQTAADFGNNFEYDFDYIYNVNNNKPHQLDYIQNGTNAGQLPEVTKFHYNASGSIRRIKHKEFGSATYTNSEIYVHNEEQLLMGYNDSVANTFAHFVYDHTGNRILKGSLGAAIASTNGQATATSFVVDPYTIYANAYYVEQPYSTVSTISKHYYMGMQRIATNLGSGEVIEEPGGEPGMEKTNQTGNNAVVNNLIEVLANFGAKEGSDYTREQLTQSPNFTDYYPQDSSMQTQANKATTPQGTASALDLDPPPGPTVPSARLLYYYHPDYLGNVEYITDASGMPYQYFFYSPWGEPLADQKANTNANWDSPYKFNGKELDEETGLYYYGARYYNPQVSVWLGVDAMADKYPNLSPYVFVANNPIMLVDPDGNQIDPASQAEWDANKQNIQNERNALFALGTFLKTEVFDDRIASLDKTLSGMATMEDPNNSTVYKLAQAAGGVAETRMNLAGEIIIETNGTTESFVHEVTHGIQYENNALGFVPGGLTVTSLQNEVEAYNAEFAYKGSLANGINPTVPIVTDKNQITKSFVYGIIDPRDGSKLYKDHALMSIHPDMGADRCNAALPKISPPAQPGETLRSMYPNVKWKR